MNYENCRAESPMTPMSMRQSAQAIGGAALNQMVTERQTLPDVGCRLRDAIEQVMALRDRLNAIVQTLGVPVYDGPARDVNDRPVIGLVDDFHDKLDRLVQLQGECHALTDALARA